jgi:hypothetical protein
MKLIIAMLLGAAFLCAASFQQNGVSTPAQARVGNPFSAGSVAGVHRRSERRDTG